MAKNKRKRKNGSGVNVEPESTSCCGKPGRQLLNDQQQGRQPSSKPPPPLAQLLKKHRGVAATTPPPPIWKRGGGSQHTYLTPREDPNAFDECLKTCFEGFHYDSPDSLPSSLHRDFDSSFTGMDEGGLFLHDVVQPGKKRLTKTSVTRTLVGDPGSTYKYLGLRLFSHPWVDVDANGNSIPKSPAAEMNGGLTLRKIGYPNKTASALILMGRINSDLINRSKSMLEKHVAPNVQPVGLVGSAQFNLTLVNKMEPAKELKRETEYGMGKISVGWHRDSGLKDFSSIAVYQSLKEVNPSKNTDSSWGVALRAMDGGAGGPLPNVPPLLIPLPSGSLYYMLDDFNHNHEHAVIAGLGGSTRYSSTHRVAREGQGSWQYIRDKVKKFTSTTDLLVQSQYAAISSTTMSLKKQRERLVSQIRALQNLMDEVEFEWLRQWFIQGRKHAALHLYWHIPIQVLCDSFCELEHATLQALELVSDCGSKKLIVTEDLFDVLIEALSARAKLRTFWKEKYQDPLFDNIPEDERPFPCPCLDRVKYEKGQVPEDLEVLVSNLRQWRSTFVSVEKVEYYEEGQSALGVKKSKKSRPGSLTKKESKQKASNWERLRAHMTK